MTTSTTIAPFTTVITLAGEAYDLADMSGEALDDLYLELFDIASEASSRNNRHGWAQGGTEGQEAYSAYMLQNYQARQAIEAEEERRKTIKWTDGGAEPGQAAPEGYVFLTDDDLAGGWMPVGTEEQAIAAGKCRVKWCDRLAYDCEEHNEPQPPVPAWKQEIIEIAEKNAGVLMNHLEWEIAKDNLELSQLATAKGRHSRFGSALELGMRGGWELPSAQGQPFLIDSQAGVTGNLNYEVMCKAVPGQGHNVCQCVDYNYFAGHKLFGNCKHVVAAFFLYQASLIYAARHAGQAQAQHNEERAAA